MRETTIDLKELRNIFNYIFLTSYDKTAIWLKLLDIVDYYDPTTSIAFKEKIEKEIVEGATNNERNR